MNESTNTIKNIDKTIEKAITIASNKVPVAGPVISKILWKNKLKILTVVLGVFLVFCFALEGLTLQFASNARGLIEQIPTEQKSCIDNASNKFGIENTLLYAYGKVIADFKIDHKGSGKGFLEISEITWKNYGRDGDNNKTISENDMCDNYFTLAGRLASINGDSNTKIEQYDYPNKTEVKRWYEFYKGAVLVPYGNPIGLDRTDIITVTSGYNIVRIIDGVVSVHDGVDIIPNSKWFEENPGKGLTDVVERAILSGTVTNFKDSNGALCSFVTSSQYRTLYCHCSAFIAQNQSVVKYGDPICFMGNTGFSTSAHVHIGIYQKNDNGSWSLIDPTPFIFPKKS